MWQNDKQLDCLELFYAVFSWTWPNGWFQQPETGCFASTKMVKFMGSHAKRGRFCSLWVEELWIPVDVGCFFDLRRGFPGFPATFITCSGFGHPGGCMDFAHFLYLVHSALQLRDGSKVRIFWQNPPVSSDVTLENPHQKWMYGKITNFNLQMVYFPLLCLITRGYVCPITTVP